MTASPIAVIVPAHGQAALLPEALNSALAQPEAVVVVVEDGCPQRATRAVATGFAAAHPGRVFALAQPNGGLAAARNSGIDFVLTAFPGVEALFFLDADNRLLPGALGRWLLALRAAAPAVGWLYPDIDELGGERAWSTAGPFSRLALLAENYCDAGSLVRRAVFEDGLRFDPAFRGGWEDWEFFLAAVARGWAGQHHAHAGFRYRRRPESMLREADRGAAVLHAALRAKHAAQRSPRALLALAAAEAPPLALFAGDAVAFLLDPAGDQMSLAPAAARAAFLASEAAPAAAHFPAMLAFAEPAVWAALGAQRLLRGVVWHAARLLREQPLVAVLPEAATARVAIRPGAVPAAAAWAAPLLFCCRGLLVADGAAALEASTVAGLRVALPAPPAAGGLPWRHLALEAAALRLARQPAMSRGGTSGAGSGWRGEFRAPRHTALERVLGTHGIGAILPAAPGPRTIAFVVPLFELGGVEKVVSSQAAVLRARGWRTRLVVLGRAEAAAPPALATAFDDVVCVAGIGEAAVAGERYFAAAVSGFAGEPGFADALGLFADADVLVATHCDAVQALFAPLRRLGVQIWAALHITERDPWGAPDGKPHALLGHEHALDGVTVISGRLRAEALALGFPAAKLCLVRNAPTTLALPRPPRSARLRALFLGRLDAQKGLDRLAAIIAATQDTIAWRVVGAPVLDSGPPELGVPIVAPSLDPATVAAHLAWADALVLPSRFEGVPLTLLEAQRAGCVAIATDVGAVAEAIDDGVDGVLVRVGRGEAAIIGDCVAALRALAADPARMARLGAAAAARVAGLTWEVTMADWLARLDRAVPPR